MNGPVSEKIVSQSQSNELELFVIDNFRGFFRALTLAVVISAPAHETWAELGGKMRKQTSENAVAQQG